MNRRKFTDQDKIRIVQEANEYGVSKTARRHRITTSLLFVWRKQLNNPDDPIQKDELERFSKIVEPLTLKLSRAIRNDEISASAACTSFLRLVDAHERIVELKKIQKLQKDPVDQVQKRVHPPSKGQKANITAESISSASDELKSLRAERQHKQQQIEELIDQGALDRLPSNKRHVVESLLQGLDDSLDIRPMPRADRAGYEIS